MFVVTRIAWLVFFVGQATLWVLVWAMVNLYFVDPMTFIVFSLFVAGCITHILYGEAIILSLATALLVVHATFRLKVGAELALNGMLLIVIYAVLISLTYFFRGKIKWRLMWPRDTP